MLALEDSNPELVKEWHPTKNRLLSISDVSAHTSKKVWWVCDKGHEWEAPVSNRSGVKRSGEKTGCPVCANRRLLQGFNDLATTYPHLAEEWHRFKNSFGSNEVLAVSTKKVWWVCSKGHEWEAQVRARTRMKGTGCPYCAGNKVITGITDLATINPSLAKQWDKEKNGNLDPSQVLPSSMVKVWWMCENGHSVQATVNYRSRNNCGYCF